MLCVFCEGVSHGADASERKRRQQSPLREKNVSVTEIGFEPTTSALSALRSNQLSYTVVFQSKTCCAECVRANAK